VILLLRVQVLLKEKAINSLALVEEQLKLQREHAQLQQQYSEASAAAADLQQQAQQALDQQAAAEAAQQKAEQHYNAVLRDKQQTERQLQAAEKKLSTAVKVGALLIQHAADLPCFSSTVSMQNLLLKDTLRQVVVHVLPVHSAWVVSIFSVVAQDNT
jgi:multidrug efflux pump subunit AcrA (membrane-fusion protein)